MCLAIVFLLEGYSSVKLGYIFCIRDCSSELCSTTASNTKTIIDYSFVLFFIRGYSSVRLWFFY